MGNKYYLCVFYFTILKHNNMSLRETWTVIKQKKPHTPASFMQLVLECKPDITEHEIISWQRASRDWTTGLFDFVWFAFQVYKGHSEWIFRVEQMWPAIKSIIDEHSLEDLMAAMSF